MDFVRSVNTYVPMIPCGLRFYNLTLEYKPDGQLKHSIEIFEYTLNTDCIRRMMEQSQKFNTRYNNFKKPNQLNNEFKIK